MRRVLLVFDPPDGGVAENVRTLALGLAEHGWQPSVAGPRESLIYDDLLAAGIPLERLPLRPGYGHPISDLASLRGLLALLRRGRYDVVHSHNAKAGVLTRLAARFGHAPNVYSPHCFPFVANHTRPRRWTATAIEWACGRATDILLCVAEEERRQALDHRIVAEDRLRVIHNGCPRCEQEIELDDELERFRAGRPLAATLCVLREQKAVDVFVAAAPAILERCPEAALAVIGDGELRDQLQAQARELGLGDRFGFFAFRAPSARQLRSLDVFVLSSGWEAFPISVLEAMACGVPQVATDVGGTSEAVLDGETGLLCRPSDPAGLAKSVTTLLADSSLRERMASASEARHDGKFRIEVMVAKTAALYDELAPA
jgi:glycosyltransferase involved in cell wall biosynthesis